MKKHLTLLITLNSGFLVNVRVSFSQNYELRTRKFEQSTIKRKEDRILAINQGEANQPSEVVKSNLVSIGNRLRLNLGIVTKKLCNPQKS